MPWWGKKEDSPAEAAKKLEEYNWNFEEGRRLLQKGVPGTALEYFEKAERINSDSADLWFFMGVAYLGLKGKKGDAITCLNAAINRNSRHSGAIELKAQVIAGLSFWERQSLGY